MLRIGVLALAIGLGACAASLRTGESVAGVSLGAAPTAAGDSIILTLANGSPQAIGYNLCPTTVERLSGDAWENVPTDRVCTMELKTLAAGGTATFVTTLPAGSTAGDYRFATGVNIPVDGERHTVRSNVVRVRP